ncbi:MULTISPECIES: metal-sensing transcriptional repressor [Paenibacillus]|uniref:metal-sensing transcriptional repressor n=1 Tax=Paenibacillus TaxID=44249 RepID=UPI000953FC38|nr:MULTISPECIES: metal-sensing transcriptional repressor [Paenibacillus]ASS68125.1 metal-sensing transcriptional repressor [Paenibacillus sp. RUD330]MEC0246321.1 metal-sensing transcriptional repressor [Paenibacillus chitinolyticus]SIR68649.1 DNA-binding transcriptional regulator, FrmR family [Paenibacillus sp. RU4X]SIR76126.1 DNA-binding transcriptional regulator, FrmR family [Paenibacillus sp. RU4T]
MTTKESKASPQTESYLNAKEKLAIALRLNRIEGQVRGVQRQVERNDNCDQVLHQIAAVHNALHGVGKLVLLHRLKSYMKSKTQLNEEAIVDGMLESMNKLIR